jgi:hypothetical protein
MNFQHEGIPIGLAAASSLISRLNRDHNFDTLKEHANIKLELTTAFVVMHNGYEAIEKVKPDRVVLFNGRFSTLRPLVDICKKQQIDYEVHERGANASKFMTRLNESIHSISAAEREINELWGDGGSVKETIALKWFKDRREGKVQQWYSFVNAQKPFRLPFGFDTSKRNILICNSTIEEYCTIPGWERTEIGEDNEVIEKILLAFENEPDFVFYLRCHPNLKATDNTQIRELHDLAARYQNLVFISPEADIGSYALLDACEKIITFGSTMGAEAVVYKKPSILVGPALYQGLGITYNAESLEVLTALIRALDLPAKSVIGALQYGYWEATRGTPFKYYQADDLASGKFKGKEIKSAFLPRIFSKLYRTIKLL